MNKLFTKIAAVVLGMTMATGVGVAVASNGKVAVPVQATDYSITIDKTMDGYSGWGSGAYGSGALRSATTGGISIHAHYATRNNKNSPSGATAATYIQVQKSNATLYNATEFSGRIKSIVLTQTTAAPWDLYAGKEQLFSDTNTSTGQTPSGTKMTSPSSATTMTWDSTNLAVNLSGDDYTFFCFKLGGTNTYVSSIVVTYEVIQKYSVTYKANGGSGNDYVVSGISSGTQHSLVSVATAGFTAPTGKQFKCWSMDSTERDPGYSFSVTANKTVNAVWEDLPSTPYINLSLTSSNPAYKGSTVTVSASSGNLKGTGLAWTVTSGSVTNISSSDTAFSGTLASTGAVTIKAQDNGGDTYDTVSVTVNAVTVSLNESAISVAQGGTSSLTATVNTGSVIWSSNNAKITVEADSGNALKGNISVAADATAGSTAVITATSTVDSSVKATCTLTVSENPFANLTKVDDAAKVSTSAVYALSNEGTFWAGLTTSSSGIVDATDYEDVGFFKLESTTGGYYLKFVVKNAQTGAWEDKSSNKYVNNSSSTNIAFEGTASSVWAANYDATGEGVILQNTSNSNRFLGWNATAAASGKIIKAYATSNLHTGGDNAPVYLYEVPQNKLDGLTVSGQTKTFTAGSTFTLGNNAVLTAHYSSTGNTTDLSGGTISYKINNVTVTTSTVLDHDTHNGKSVVITYTDAAGDVASTTAYTITVNYKPAGSISLNLDSAPLSIGGSVSLTATVGDEYADENDVSWSTTSAGIASISAASGTKTITVTGVSAGSATITATANGHSATCDITVTADPILNLKDSGDNIINDETLEYFTGDSSVMIMAESENVVSPVYNWSNEDDSVVTIDDADEYCEVTIVGAGSSEVSITVGALTRTVTFSISQSGVTSLTLDSSVPSGELFDGTYKNTLTLTPAVTLVGNATGVINWSSSDTDVATVSNASTTAPTAITVTGVGEGTATITARSAYTPSMSETFDVTVTADEINSLSWTKRPKFNSGATGFQTIWAGETTLGNLMEQNGSDGIGVFAPSWKSGKSDSPTMGTGAHNVHIVLSDVGGPTSEAGLTPLTSSYVFQATDNGKYVVAFYEGKASTNNTQLSITKWRNVKETSSSTATYNFTSATSSTTAMSSLTFDGFYVDSSTLAKGTSSPSYIYPDSGSIKLASGSYAGALTITFESSVEISSVTVRAKLYGTDSTVLTVMGNDIDSLGENYVDYTFTVANGDFTTTNEFELYTGAKKQRCYIESIIIVAGGEQDIGKTSDCLGLEEYIDTYLHMADYTTSQGWCKDEEHNYYGKNTETGAKYHFNQLNAHQRSLLSSNSAYSAEWARLSAWAAANGESLNASTLLAAGRTLPIIGINGESTNTIAIIVVISMISATAIGGYFFLRKRKEQ